MATQKSAPHNRGITQTIHVKTSRRTELKDFTSEIESAVRDSGCAEGVCHLYVPHTTAGVLINEGDDPAVARDIESTLDRLIPHAGIYTHAEGNSDSHIKTALVGSSQIIFIEIGRLAWPLAINLLRRIRRPTHPRPPHQNRSRSERLDERDRRRRVQFS